MYIEISGQENPNPPKKTFKPNLGYICDAGRNFSGGIKEGNTYMGLVFAGMLVSTDKLWTGGEFKIEWLNSHGHNLSSNHIGDLQVVSNIENGDYTFLYQLYYTQHFSKSYLTLGIHDLNSEFTISHYGAALTNSSFGIPSTFSLNFPVSVYPKNALAILYYYKANNAFSFRVGLYDSDAGSLDDDPHNLDWSINGIMPIGEVDYNSCKALSSSLKFGGYYLSGEYSHSTDTLKSYKGNYGIYLVADQMLINTESKKLGIFAQLSYAPSNRNYNTLYSGIGLNLFAPFKKRPDDVIACGIACVKLHKHSYECDVELNYCFNLNKNFSLQPALHYIINPGANNDLENAFAGFLRISISI